MNYNKHILLNNLNRPWKFLIFTGDEIGLMMLVFIFGVVMDYFVVGMIASGLSCWLLREFKTKYSQSYLTTMIYQYGLRKFRTDGILKIFIH